MILRIFSALLILFPGKTSAFLYYKTFAASSVSDQRESESQNATFFYFNLAVSVRNVKMGPLNKMCN
jgi:hypothetical protein